MRNEFQFDIFIKKNQYLCGGIRVKSAIYLLAKFRVSQNMGILLNESARNKNPREIVMYLNSKNENFSDSELLPMA